MTRQPVARQPLSLREARTAGALATAVALTASAGVGAGAGLTAGPGAGIVAGLVTAAVTLWAATAAIRLRVTSPRD